MSKLVWDNTGDRLYQTGADRGVLFPKKADGSFAEGVAWNGLKSVSESPSGAEATAIYADNIKYLNLMSAEEYGFTIGAYTYPDEFEECDGSYTLSEGVVIGQQPRKHFGFAFRTLLGNDVVGDQFGYKLHLVYDCLASPSSKEHNTINEGPEATEMSWEVSTTKVAIGDKMASTIVIDSTKVSEAQLKTLEDKLYGTDSQEPTLPTPAEVIAMFASTNPGA